MSEAYRVGAAHRKVTPAVGSQMAGFDARKGVSMGVHDELCARALCIEHNAVCVLLVSVEVISVSREFCWRVRKRIETATGIPAAHIVIAATHTHCGPPTHNHFYNRHQPLDTHYLKALQDAICTAAEKAQQQMALRHLRAGFARCEQLAVNRRTADGMPVDPMAGVLLVENADGTPYAVAVNYACHATVLGPNTLEYTGDFPFFTQRYLQQHLGEQVEAIFFNGAEGDISIGHKSDLSAVGIIAPYRNFETAQKLGEKLGAAVVQAISRYTEVEGELAIASVQAPLPLKSYASIDEMRRLRVEAAEALKGIEALPVEQQLPIRQKSLFARIEEYYAELYAAERGPAPGVLAAEVVAIRFGDVALVTLPGEIFVAVALGIRNVSPMAKTMFLGLANDYIGYLPSDGAAVSVGYEVVASRVTDDAWQQLHASALEILHRVATAS